MTIKLYFTESSSVNIENYVDMSTFSIQSRCDEAFATGSFKAYLPSSLNELFKYNVAPYTKIVVSGASGTEVDTWLCSSECHKHLTKSGLYIHDFTLIEAASILSCFILGTKSFSVTGTNTKDSAKIGIIFDLMKQKYGYTFNGSGYTAFTSEIEYSFGAGTTMYDALSEIAKHYNYKVYVSSLGNKSVTVSWRSLKKSSKTLNSNSILSVSYSQNSDEYGLTLETEANNVVDRSTTVLEQYITCRADDILLNNDTAKVYLSSNIEQLKDFGINLGVPDESDVVHYLQCTKLRFYISTDVEALVNTTEWQSCQWGDLAHYLDDNGYDLKAIYDNYLSEFIDDYDEMSTCWLQLNYQTSGSMFFDIQSWDRTYDSDTYPSTMFHKTKKYSLMHKTLEENEFNLLTAQDQTGYACYKSGSNYIQNLNAEYKKDFWNIIIGESRNGLMHSSTMMARSNSVNNCGLDGFGKLEYAFTASGYDSPAMQAVPFYAEYIPITNIFVKDDKTDTPVNETEYKPFGRSYNVSASLIDFDKMATNINVTNGTLGRPELQLEISGLSILASNYVTYDDVTWYVSSSVTGYKNGTFTTVLNLVRDYNKVAECIGVETQFNSTKNPYSGTVERPIFVEDTTELSLSSNTLYLLLQFKDANGNLITMTNNGTTYNKYLVRATCQIKDDTAYIYSAMSDEYSIGLARKALKTNAELTDVPYVDSNNECKYVSISVVYGVSLDIASSNLMPMFNGTYQTLTSKSDVLVYKDAREILAFTYKIKLT